MGNTESALGLATQTVTAQDPLKSPPNDTPHWTGSTLSLNSTTPSRAPSLNEKPNGSVAYAPGDQHSDDDSAVAYEAFIKLFPEYQLTWILDTLRRTDYSRLDCSGETYVDYMGGALYPESLIRVHANFLGDNILGNTHSISNR
jgi:molybdenum cofactor sulfurtransferase